MKIQHAEQHVLGSRGLSETKNFTIRTNAHAFKMLSSGLYSDKIAAVLREIGCNAADAHTEYGSPEKPIIVKLPNRIDNQFYIRDYGPGLSHEDVMNLYTTYFASTKQNSNDYTGAFGLGSKSPFSYTDSFTVVSVHKGIKRTYSAYLDNQGSPTISKLTETKADDDWPHGVQIGFPVKYEDFRSFQERAQNIYQWFKVTPTVEGSQPIKPAKPTFENKDFLYQPGLGIRCGCIMGNVFYPVDLAKLGIANVDYYRPSNSKIESYAGIFPGIVLKLNIGDVQVAASREELQYDPDSQKVLKAKIAEAVQYIADDLATKFRAAKTWEERCTSSQNAHSWGVNISSGYWQGLFSAAGHKDAILLAATATKESVTLPATTGTKATVRFLSYNNKQKIVNGKNAKYLYGSGFSIKMIPETMICYTDKQLALHRCRKLIQDGLAKQILLFTPMERFTAADALKEAKDTASYLGISKVEDINGFPLPADYVPPKKKKKLKNGKLPPLPSVQKPFITFKARGGTEDISTTKNTTFMVRAKGAGRYRNDMMRVYANTADTDQMIDEDQWNAIWRNVFLLSKHSKFPYTGYFEFTAMEVKGLDIAKRGWQPTYNVIDEWLKSPQTIADIAASATKWKPSMVLSEYGISGWAGELVWMRHTARKTFDIVAPTFKRIGILKNIEDIHDTSIALGEDAGTQEPVGIVAYRELSSVFKTPPIQAKTNNGNYITIEDFDKAIVTKFPLTKIFDRDTFRSLYNSSPNKVEEFINMIFT